MTELSMELFRQACGVIGPLRLIVERPAGHEVFSHEFDQPFILVGREVWADLALDDPAVSRRHAYLQVIAGKVFCLDLESRSGVLWEGQPRRSGWLEPDRPVGIGPFAVHLRDGTTAQPEPASDENPLASRPSDQDPLPAVNVEVISGSAKGRVWRMNRVLALVGQARDCKVRVEDWGVGLYHCGLLRTPLGLWVVDLLGSSGVSVNRSPVRYARLGHGDELLVGDTLLSVRYDPAPGPAVPLTRGVTATSGPPLVENAPSDVDQLRSDRDAAQAEVEVLRARVGELERSLDELVQARERLDQADTSRKEQLDVTRTEAESLRAELITVRGQLDTERATWQAETDRHRQEADARREECDRLGEQAEKARAELEAARAERAAAEQQWRAELDTARAESDAEANTLRARVTELERSADEAVTEAEVLRDQVFELRRSATEATGEVERLQAEIDGLRTECKRTETIISDRDAARTEVETLLARVSVLERSADELAQARDALARADVSRGEQREELDTARVEAARLREELETARGQLKEEQEGRRAETTHIRQEADALRQELESSRAKMASEIETLSSRVVELERSTSEAAQTHEERERTWWDEQTRREAERQELLDRLQEEARGREADRLAAAEVLDTVRAESDRLRGEADSLRGDSERTEALQTELEMTRMEMSVLRTQAEEMQRSADELVQARDALGRTDASNREQLDAIRVEAERLRGELEVARGQLDTERATWQAEADRLRQRIEVLRQDREMLIHRLEALPEEPDHSVIQGAEPGISQGVAGAYTQAGPSESELADQARAELQKQLAEAGRQLREARDRAAHLEAELRGRQQWLTFNVVPLTLPPDQGGANRSQGT